MQILILVLILVVVTACVYMLTHVSASKISEFLKKTLRIIIFIISVFPTFLIKSTLGIIIVIATLVILSMIKISGKKHPVKRRFKNQKPIIRTKAIEIELEPKIKQIDGKILKGSYKYRKLNSLSFQTIHAIYDSFNICPESAALLEAYLDCRHPGWREHINTHIGTWQSTTMRSGTMSKEEAYQILGLPIGAESREITKAYRSLIKWVHPDNGGSIFLAIKINKAKEVLVKQHH